MAFGFGFLMFYSDCFRLALGFWVLGNLLVFVSCLGDLLVVCDWFRVIV